MSPRTTSTVTLQQLSNSSNHHKPRMTRAWLVAFCATLALLTVLLSLGDPLVAGNHDKLLLSSFYQSSSSSSSSASSTTTTTDNHNDSANKEDDDFALAAYESYGFLDDISTREWKLLKQRVRDVHPNTLGEVTAAQLAMMKNLRASDFYQDYYEPEFACRHERRVGQRGDGGKWVCDPHRLQAKPDCLVYSVGSEGDASFERAVRDEIGNHW